MYPVTQDFMDKMKADRRQVLARVVIDYTDPFIDQSIRIEANEQANASYPQQTADSVDQTTRKYACLDGTLDLTSREYHLAPSADRLTQQQFGWWGAQFAEKDGLKFDGIDDYVDCGNDFTITNQLTLEAWVKMNSYTAFPRIVGAENVWILYITDLARNHRLAFYGSGIDTPFPNSPNLNDGKWHHVAAVYDGDGIDGYVDGVYVGTIEKSGNLNDIGSTPVTIGGRTTGARTLDGAIREVRIWNSARNQDEIRDNIHKELHGDESGLIGYWKINEGSGSIITDSAGSNDGTIYGATWLVPGSFEPPYPTLTVRHLPRPIRQLKVVGDTAREEYPVDFTIKLYGPDDTLLKTETVTGNDQVSWSKILEPQVLDVAKQELIITRWSLPGTCAKIIEFFTSIREVYETGDLVSLRLLEEREASQGSLPVGNISSNEITLALNNESKKFDIDNENSPLKNLLKPNRRIQAWLGAEAENAAAENPPTFTRDSVAYQSDGTQVAVNVPRFEQGKFGKAVMVEEGTTNLILYSEQFNNAAWLKGQSIISANATTGPFGTQTADKLVANTTTDIHSCYQTRSGLSTDTNYTFSVYLKKAEYKYANVSIDRSDRNNRTFVIVDLDTGQFVNGPKVIGAGSALVQAKSEYVANGYWRVQITINSGANTTFNCAIWAVADGYQTQDVPTFAGDGVSGIYLFGAQFEAKAYATSYFPTTSSISTRSPETLTIPTTGVLNENEFDITGWFIPAANSSVVPAWARIWDLIGVSLTGLYISGGIIRFAWNNSPIINTNISLSANDQLFYSVSKSDSRVVIRLAKNGGALSTFTGTTDGTTSGTTGISLGSNGRGGSFYNGKHDDLRISSRARTDEEILAAYQSNKPLQRDEDTTYLLSFNGSIYPVEMCWVPLGTFWSLDWDSPDDTLEATVTARDRMELLRKGTYQTSQVLTNKSLYELAEIVLQDAGLNSSEYIIDTALQNIIVPYAWFNPVPHREALRQIAEAGLAAAFANREGKIQIESFLITGNGPVLEITEDDYFPPLRAPSRQDQVANEIIVDTQPLRPATTQEEVYRSNEPITIPGSSTKTITAFYNKTPVIEATASLDNPPVGVSITEVTYYGWGASIKIQNTNATDQQVTLVIQGKPLTVQNKERAITRDETSITENGVLRYEFPANPLVQTLAQAQAIADTLLASVKESRRDIEVEWRGNPALLLGDRVTVKGKDYHVIRQEISWVGYMQAKLTGRKAE